MDWNLKQEIFHTNVMLNSSAVELVIKIDIVPHWLLVFLKSQIHRNYE